MLNTTHFLLCLTAHLAKSKKPVVYIAGKVTGLPTEEVKAKFETAKATLEAHNFHVINPCEFIKPNENWHTAMRMASTMLNMVNHIYLLPDWQDSEGARFEFAQAVKFGISCINE
jgi:hypothetical protein